MEGEDLQDSSDDSFSYKNSAKRALQTARKKIAAVKPLDSVVLIGDLSSDSEDNRKIREPSPVKAKTATRPKRKSARQRAARKSKRLRRESYKVLSSGSDSQSRKGLGVSSSDYDSNEDSTVLPTAIPSSKLNSKTGNGVVECINLSSEEIGSDVHSEEYVEVSDSSEVELLQPPEIAVISPDAVANDENELMSIKISWKLQPIQKFQLRRHQKFKVLLEHFAKLEGVPLKKVVLYGGVNNCRMIESFDTPDTVGVTVTDILEGGLLSKEDESRGQRSRGLAGSQEGNGVKVRVQLEGVRSFPVMIGLKQTMKVLLMKVAEQLEVDEAKVKLTLDGEVVDGKLTAEKLGLEEGDVFDVHLLVLNLQTTSSPRK
ncbi:DNA repair protein Rad60 [Hetaerina americana]|uniref:DNA repair protein Rad60 n=1 Tax=Hetaerina americana TaxID=62018 RepID=UPI003A7F4466